MGHEWVIVKDGPWEGGAHYSALLLGGNFKE